MKKSFIFISFIFLFNSICGQQSYISELKRNVNNLDLQNIKSEKITFNEHLYPQILISDESYDLSDNAISYFDALCAIDTATKHNILKAYFKLYSEARKDSLHEDFPKELFWFPFANSAYNKNYENNGNFGIWGIQYLIAIKYGLFIDNCFDDRLDERRSTSAATKNLLHNKSTFKTWNFAILAHLFGPQILKRELANQNDFYRIYKNLDTYGNNKFDILCALISWSENFDFDKFVYNENTPDYDTIIICEKIHIEQISAVLNIDIDTLKKLNSTFHCQIINGKNTPQKFYIPKSKKDDYLTLRDSIAKFKDTIYFPELIVEKPTNTKDLKEIKYTIASGDNLGNIAQKFGVKISDIQRWNNISGTNIYAGKVLSIWIKNASSTTQSQNVSKEKQNNDANLNGYVLEEIYEVKSGDSAFKIAQKYSWVSYDDILKWNNISDPSKIQVGQLLKIYRKN